MGVFIEELSNRGNNNAGGQADTLGLGEASKYQALPVRPCLLIFSIKVVRWRLSIRAVLDTLPAALFKA